MRLPFTISHKYWLVLAGVAGLIALGALIYFFMTPTSVVVTLTTRGFEPKAILIQKGDTVLFKSDAGREYWPASNAHPSHLLYPDFDPKRQLAPNETWSFTFTEAGVYPFHDHMASTFQGTIMVEGTTNESVENCLKNENAGRKYFCYSAELTATIKKKGIDEGFRQFEKLYSENELFRNNCHDVMHVFGSQAYTHFNATGEAVIRSETSYCAYGFYHGFIEQMFLENGPQHLTKIKNYCDSLLHNENLPSKGAASTAYWACYHGIGHAVFDTIDGALWGDAERMVDYGLNRCTEISSDQQEMRMCSSGIFNSLANAQVNRTYNLDLDMNNPVGICKDKDLIVREGCYKELSGGYSARTRLSFSDFVNYTKNFEDQSYAQVLLFSFVDDYIRFNRGTVPVTTDPSVCMNMNGLPYRTGCVEGVISGITGRGAPGLEYEQALAYCELLPPGDTRRYCFAFGLTRFSTIYTDEKLQSICSLIAPSDRSERCLRI